MPSLDAKKTPARTPARRSAGWSPAARTIATLLLVLHLAAVVLASWSIPPSSELSQKAVTPFRPYLRATYLNVGYRFFAPNPPLQSNIVRYEVTLQDGHTETGTFPDRGVHRPRLAYHRHFMITSQVFEWAVPPEEDVVPADMPPAFFADAPAEEVEGYRLARTAYVQRLDETKPAMQSIAAHLLHTHGAENVKLYLKQHRVPSRQAVINGMQLTDERLYGERYLGTLVSDGTWQWSEQIRGERN